MNDIRQAAIRALDAFGVTTAREAAKLLLMWARYEEMSAADKRAVLDHYKGGAR